MLIDLNRLFDGYKGDDAGMDFNNVVMDGVSTERIKTMTMNRIKAEGSRRSRKPMRVILAAAVIMALLTGTVFAGEYINNLIKIRTNVSEGTYDEYGNMVENGIGAEIDVDALEGMETTLVGVRLGYQPQMNETGVEETVGRIPDDDCGRYCAMLSLLSQETGITDFDELISYDEELYEQMYQQAMEEKGFGKLEGGELWDALTDEVIYEVDHKKLYSDDINAMLDKYGISEETMGDVINHIYRSDGANAWGATAFKSQQDVEYVMEGEAEVIKQGVINGLSATYMTNAYYCGDEYITSNDIILHDESTGILVAVFGTYSFDELEQIAGGLTIVDTGMPIIEDKTGLGGLIVSMAQG